LALVMLTACEFDGDGVPEGSKLHLQSLAGDALGVELVADRSLYLRAILRGMSVRRLGS
jgi:hypothetical protein